MIPKLKESELFTASDFNRSLRVSRRADGYAEWAAAAAGEVAALWRERLSVKEILQRLAESRRQLALSMRVATPEKFGEPRAHESITNFDMGFSMLMDRAAPGLTTLVSGPLRYIAPQDTEPRKVRRLTRQTFHRPMTGASIETTRLGRYLDPVELPPYWFLAGTLVLEHTAVAHIAPLLDDVAARLEALRGKSEATEASLGSFFDAMHAYYHAMPFTRGSAAIGRSLFAGLFLACFGLKHSGPDADSDLLAMTATSQEDYRREMLRGRKSW
jgi:hypothetical protein